MKHNKKGRRRSALARLNKQLSTNSKNTKEGKKELSKKDISRINREISILESKI